MRAEDKAAADRVRLGGAGRVSWIAAEADDHGHGHGQEIGVWRRVRPVASIGWTLLLVYQEVFWGSEEG